MKIGTITFNRITNYGALLQAYALQRVLRSLGHNSEIIDFNHFSLKNESKNGIFIPRPKTIRQYLPQMFIQMTSGRQESQRYKRSAEFIENDIPLSESFETYEDLLDSRPDYDAYIVGSDQVWNVALPHFERVSKAVRLEFSSQRAKKISYAASFALPRLPEEHIELFQTSLQQFDAISVRETAGREIVEKQLGLKASVVLDPTLLLQKSEWEQIAAPCVPKQNYILCYFIGGVEHARDYIQLAKSHFGLPVYNLGSKTLRSVLSPPGIDRFIGDAGPREFINYIKNAEFIITNSFHGTVFACIFGKDFVSLPIGISKTNSRILSLLRILGIADKFCMDFANFSFSSPDFASVHQHLDEERAASFDFLKSSLQE